MDLSSRWNGPVSQVHLHVWLAVFLGGTITSLPVFLTIARPNEAFTRYMVAVCQMLMSEPADPFERRPD